MRELFASERQGHAYSALALDLFCYRLRKYVGAGARIGENSPHIRARACRTMDWRALRIDELRSRQLAGAEGQTKGPPVQALVIPVDEEILIGRAAFDCLNAR